MLIGFEAFRSELGGVECVTPAAAGARVPYCPTLALYSYYPHTVLAHRRASMLFLLFLNCIQCKFYLYSTGLYSISVYLIQKQFGVLYIEKAN